MEQIVVPNTEVVFTPDPAGNSFKITAPGLVGKNVTALVVPSVIRFTGQLGYPSKELLISTATSTEISYDNNMFQIIFKIKGVDVAVFQADLITPSSPLELVDCKWEEVKKPINVATRS